MKHSNRAITTEEPCGVPLDSLIDGSSRCAPVEKHPTALVSLDAACGGLPAQGLVVLAGRPDMGHRDLALVLARNLAVAFNVPAAYVSTTQSEADLAQKMLMMTEADLGTHIGVNGELHTVASLLAAKHPPLCFMSAHTGSARRLEEICRTLVERRGSRVIFLDSPEDMVSSGRYHDFYDLGRLLRGLASQLGICIVAVTHLSRAVEYRGGCKVPMLSDLRSGLEIHADLIMLMYRAAYYGIMEDEYGPTCNRAELYLHKGGFEGRRVCLEYSRRCSVPVGRGVFDAALRARIAPAQLLSQYRKEVAKMASDAQFVKNEYPELAPGWING